MELKDVVICEYMDVIYVWYVWLYVGFEEMLIKSMIIYKFVII